MQRKSAVRVGSELAGVAQRQHGLITRAQLMSLGLGPGAVEYRLRTGSLHRVHGGVYAVGHRALGHLAHEMAAVLASGEGAVVSHRSAGALWGILDRRPAPVEVTVRDRCKPVLPGVVLHSTTTLEPRDVRRLEGVPLACPARTVLDLAAVLRPWALEQAAAQAQVRRLVSRRDLVDQLERNVGRRGAGRLRALLDLDRDPVRLRSRTEGRLLRLFATAGLPTPEVNARVGPYEVDFLWRDQRLIVEYDGWATHSSRRSFEADRERDAELQAMGYRVLRVTWRQLEQAPARLIQRVRRALAAGAQAKSARDRDFR